MNKRTKLDTLIQVMGLEEEEILVADGFDEAIIGLAQIFNKHIVMYDREKCLKILMKSGMGYDEAEEYFSFNVTGAYVGETAPGFVTKI